MKNKILVEILVPSIDERFNLFIPINKRIGSVVLLINKAIVDLMNGQFEADDTASLYDRGTGERIDYNKLVRETNIKNGSFLILM